jgi:nitrogen fixation protein FixH
MMLTRGMSWPIGIGAILMLTVGANIVVYRVANNDPSFAIEPDYYRKAVAWDSTASERRVSAALGWSAPISLVRTGSALALRAMPRDANGTPLRGATITAQLFPIARSQHVDSVAMTESTPGQYSADVSQARAGLWEVRLSVTHGSNRWASVDRVEVQ